MEQVRDSKSIARRALALFGAIGVALGSPRTEVLNWLTVEGLWDELSPVEATFLSADQPTRQQVVDATWWSERLIILLWALGKIAQLPAPDTQCDTGRFQDLLPPFTNISVAEFIASAVCRSEQELWCMADKLMGFHWKARDAAIDAKTCEVSIDIEIVQERHHAINWVVGYKGLSWDDVTTDT